MWNLIKYDFIRKYKMVLIALISAITLNILAIFQYGEQGIILFLPFFVMVAFILYAVDIVKMYSDDLNKKSGYMLFMTANSGYKIILSKVITAIFEGVFMILLCFVFFIINGIYFSMSLGINFISINETIQFLNDLISGTFGVNLGHLAVFLFMALIAIICFILTVYTSITIRKSIFSEIQLGGLLSFLIFLFLNWLTTVVFDKVVILIYPTYKNMFIVYENGITALNLLMLSLPVFIFTSILCALMTVCSGYLLEKKINL